MEIEAAIGIKQLDKFYKIIKHRRENASIFCSNMKKFNDFSIQMEIGESSWFGFAIILKNQLKGKRDSIVKKLISEDIEVRPIVAGNFTLNPVVKYMDYEISGKLKNADYIHENGFFVGNHSQNLSHQIKRLIDIFSEFSHSN